jgi:hypothetical protein
LLEAERFPDVRFIDAVVLCHLVGRIAGQKTIRDDLGCDAGSGKDRAAKTHGRIYHHGSRRVQGSTNGTCCPKQSNGRSMPVAFRRPQFALEVGAECCLPLAACVENHAGVLDEQVHTIGHEVGGGTSDLRSTLASGRPPTSARS